MNNIMYYGINDIWSKYNFITFIGNYRGWSDYTEFLPNQVLQIL